MKDKKRKTITNIIIVIVLLGMIATLFAGIDFSKIGAKPINKRPEPVVAMIKKGPVGSVAKVILTDNGKEKYKDAVKFQLFDVNKNISAVSSFNENINVFPAKKPNDKVKVRLLNKSNKLVDEIDVVLEKLKK